MGPPPAGAAPPQLVKLEGERLKTVSLGSDKKIQMFERDTTPPAAPSASDSVPPTKP